MWDILVGMSWIVLTIYISKMAYNEIKSVRKRKND